MIRNLSYLARGGDDKPSNRRSAGRVRCEGVTCAWGKLLDASATGARLISRRSLKPGDIGVLEIEGPDRRFRVRAKIVWSRKRGWWKHEVGVQFVDVPPEARQQLTRIAEYGSRDVIIQDLSDTTSEAA